MNPWIIVAALVCAGLAGAGGIKVGRDYEIAKQAREVELIAKVKEQAMQGAALAIADIEIKQTTIRQAVEHTIRENTIYRDCVVDPVTNRLLDDARANQQPLGGSSLSGAGSSSSSNLW